jgi:hypothetical protein
VDPRKFTASGFSEYKNLSNNTLSAKEACPHSWAVLDLLIDAQKPAIEGRDYLTRASRSFEHPSGFGKDFFNSLTAARSFGNEKKDKNDF